jgi:hypothetical protein
LQPTTLLLNHGQTIRAITRFARESKRGKQLRWFAYRKINAYPALGIAQN